MNKMIKKQINKLKPSATLAINEESGKFLSLGAGMGNVFSSAVVNIL